MSIFSRLFNKNSEGDGKEDDDDQRGEATQSEGAKKPDHKASMRPIAPSFEISPPEEVAANVPAARIQVGVTAPRPSPNARPGNPARATQESPNRATAGGDPPPGKGRAGSSTLAMGSPVPYAPPPQPQKAPSPGPERAVPPLPPLPQTSQQPAAPATKAPVTPSKVPGSRPKLARESASFVMPKPVGPPIPREEPAEPTDGVLTLELGAPGLAPPPATIRGFGAPPPATVLEGAIHAGASEQVHATPGLGELASLSNDLDTAFGAMIASGATNGAARPGRAIPSGAAVSELRELFTALAANHMRPVRDFMIALKWGDAPREWAGICRPAVTTLGRAAKQMDLLELAALLDVFLAALSETSDAPGSTIGGEQKASLEAAYAKMGLIMPEVFALDGERGRRESIIVHALLQMIPEMGKGTIDKLYGAGLLSLDTLFVAKADEIAATTGISEELARTIVERFRRYREESAVLSDATRASERRRLSELLAELKRLHERYEAVASDWSDDGHAQKKRLRAERAEAMLQIKVLLARLGEVDRLGQLERLPFEKKIEKLEVYLREAQAELLPAPLP